MTNPFKLHPQLFADTLPVADLPLSRVLLMNDRNYPWLILVPRRADISEIYQLSKADQTQLHSETTAVGELLMAEFNGDKLNVAMLGNLVPQLHVHVIARQRTDVAWPQPVWGKQPALAYSHDQRTQTLQRMQQRLRDSSLGASVTFPESVTIAE